MKPKTKSRQVDRSSTGIAGLDVILNGGLPSGHFYLIQGKPGVGKTTLALQFLLAGARIGERGLYITLFETRQELLAVAASHNLSLDALSIIDISFIKKQLSPEQSLFKATDVERIEVVSALLTESDRMKPLRVVFDSVSELRLLSGDSARYLHQILELKSIFGKRGSTTLFLDDYGPEHSDLQEIERIAHGILLLEQTGNDFGAEHRRLRVRKLRGSDFKRGYHNFLIEEGGLRVFPRLVAGDYQAVASTDCLPSEVSELDALLGGGIHRGTSTLFSGPTGTGKSTLAMHFAVAAAKKGEKCIYYSFEENLTVTTRRATALGLRLAPLIENGTIILRQVDPGELSPGEFAHGITQAVLAEEVKVVILDSLNGYLNAMPDEKFLTIQLHELLMFLSQRGVITILTVAQHGVVENGSSPIDVSYLADTVLILRYFEALGDIKKAISVVKKRSGPHETKIREFRIQSSGIEVGQPLDDFQGVLTGTPEFHGTKAQML